MVQISNNDAAKFLNDKARCLIAVRFLEMKKTESEDVKHLFDNLDGFAQEQLRELRKKYPDEGQLMRSKEFSDLTKTVATEIEKEITSSVNPSHGHQREKISARRHGVTTLGLPTINLPIPVVTIVIGLLLWAIYHGATT